MENKEKLQDIKQKEKLIHEKLRVWRKRRDNLSSESFSLGVQLIDKTRVSTKIDNAPQYYKKQYREIISIIITVAIVAAAINIIPFKAAPITNGTINWSNIYALVKSSYLSLAAFYTAALCLFPISKIIKRKVLVRKNSNIKHEIELLSIEKAKKEKQKNQSVKAIKILENEQNKLASQRIAQERNARITINRQGSMKESPTIGYQHKK